MNRTKEHPRANDDDRANSEESKRGIAGTLVCVFPYVAAFEGAAVVGSQRGRKDLGPYRAGCGVNIARRVGPNEEVDFARFCSVVVCR